MSRSRNHLLSALSDADYDLLRPHLTEVELKLGQTLEAPNTSIEHVFFILQGLGSTLAVNTAGERSEVFLFGCDHMSGGSLVNGSGRSPLETTVQAPGTALRMEAARFMEACRASPTMLSLFLLANEARSIQMAYTALSNVRHTIEQRLARWLLMAHDRLPGNHLPLTHEFLAVMLGVRRAGVTTATHVLEGHHMIRATRGLIEVRDREKLREFAGVAYGIPEAEYERLIGRPI